MRVKASLKSLKTRKGCRIVRRGRNILIINRENPRFKARQG